ncbi:hypothetical protein Hanom_Chr16g01497181 [Helianthus anomalus]
MNVSKLFFHLNLLVYGCHEEFVSRENAEINFSFVNCSGPCDLTTNVWNTMSFTALIFDSITLIFDSSNV